ncbi:phage tail protein [Escherichia coli]|uniref:tail fiber protein n=1 Tax=Escherichia coli TaxID=562 RepID=UPI001125A452
MGEGSALPVGVPVPWPLETPPTGWLKCNGAAFGGRLCTACWCARSVALRNTTNGLAKMQWCSIFF